MVAMAVHLGCYGQNGTNDDGKPAVVAHQDAVRETEPSKTLAAMNIVEQPTDPRAARDTSSSDAAIDGQAASPAAPAAATGAAPKVKRGFFARWGRAYMMDWTGTTPTDPNAPQRRGTPPPIPAPPYPASDWPMGGTQEIGAPDYSSYQLQQAIDGDPNKLSKIKWYGWMSVGANGSTNNRGNPGKGIGANAPSAYDVYPNTVVLDQLALYVERLADTVQKDHFDWGFRFTNLYGQDYRYTT